jgi:hypothetical protein
MPHVGEVERRIGAHVAELVPNGATIQLGIGAIPTAVCALGSVGARGTVPRSYVFAIASGASMTVRCALPEHVPGDPQTG